MASTSMTTKLKLGLFFSVACALLYIVFAYISTRPGVSGSHDTLLALRKDASVGEELARSFRPPPIQAYHAAAAAANDSGVAQEKQQQQQQQPVVDPLHGVTSFAEALERVASPGRSVLLTLVDQAFHAMAINFFLTCVKPWGVRHYLVLTMHPDTCGVLRPHGIHCFFFRSAGAGDAASKWGTQAFKDKMNVRTEFLLQALAANFSVLHTDIDVYCFKDILEAVSCPRHSCDIAPLIDSSAFNAGFLFINPSPASVRVYQRMAAIAEKNPRIDDQAQLNTAMREQQRSPAGGLRINRLPMDQYFCGLTYYEKPRRYFAASAAPCPKCVVVHNNWIVSMQAKTYRAKEMHQWMYDGENPGGGYYTDPHAKYLRYTTAPSSEHNIPALKAALAIAQTLNRTLILPAFWSRAGSPVPLLSVLRVAAFDAVFVYREHSFSTHPLVPPAVKESASPVYVLATDAPAPAAAAVPAPAPAPAGVLEGARVLQAEDPLRGMTDAEIRQHLGSVQHAILQLYVPHNAFAAFLDPDTQQAWLDKCARGIKPGAYRQYS